MEIFRVDSCSHTCMPIPIRVQSCVCCLFWTNRDCMAVTSIFLSHYPIRDMNPLNWKYLLTMKRSDCKFSGTQKSLRYYSLSIGTKYFQNVEARRWDEFSAQILRWHAKFANIDCKPVLWDLGALWHWR